MKYWCAVLSLILLTACSSQPHYAPVLPYVRDLLGQKNYVIKKGDTLYSIGYRSGIGYKRLGQWNKIFPPYTLQVGQTIKLYEPKQTVKATKPFVQEKKQAQKTRNSSQKTSSISNNNKKMLKLYWQWPIQGKLIKNFTQTGKKGIDIKAQVGQQVRAAAAGKVVYSGSGLSAYGNLVIIKHNWQYLSAYANNRNLQVKEGQEVKNGQVIAEVGQVGGKETSLHFEIRKNGEPVNPLYYLPK